MSERLSLKSKIKIVLISLVSVSLIGVSLGLAINLVIQKISPSLAIEEKNIQTSIESEAPVKIQEDAKKTDPASSSETAAEYTSGKYLVGQTIPAGIYKLFAPEKHPGFYRISKRDSIEYSDIIENDIFIRFTYIALEKGQHLTLTDASAVEAQHAPAFTAGEEGYRSGKYLVGKDIPAGNYTVYPEKDYGYLEITSSPLKNENSLILSKYIRSPHNITVSEGEFIKLSASYIQ